MLYGITDPVGDPDFEEERFDPTCDDRGYTQEYDEVVGK